MVSEQSPFLMPIPADIPLPNAPLVRVLSQIRFPLIASIEKQDFIASFQEEQRKEFPIFQLEQGKALLASPEGFQLQNQTIWRFKSLDEKSIISLASNFVAFEVKHYGGKKKFLNDWMKVLKCVQTYFQPSRIERIGIRYLNQIRADQLGQMSTMLRREIWGILETGIGRNAKHVISEAVFSASENGNLMLSRWGLLDAGLTHDPTVLAPIEEKSWILDIDAFSQVPMHFEVSDVIGKVNELADVDYRFFRWAVTGDFLKAYGGVI